MSKLKILQPGEDKQEFLDIDEAASDDGDEQKHEKLLNAISKLGNKKMKITQRTEPVSRINEHALVQVGSGKSKTNKIKVDDLLNVIAEKPRLGALKKAVKQAKSKSSTLKAPLEKPQALRVERAAGYEKVKDEVSKWDDIVKGNRVAEQLIFPLDQPSIKMQSASDFTAKFKPKTPLEQQISELLRCNRHVQAENEELTPAEKEALTSMSLKEALARRRELAKSRALQSYQEAKARRQNKIKSKTYHRLLKKEKMKNHVKEFDSLKEHDPQRALEKLEQLDKKRIEERMTLKHKGAGKWAKLQAIRSKYDQNARESLADQLRLGKEVTRKIKKPDDESEEDIPSVPLEKSDNPWLGGSLPDSSHPTTEVTSGYRKLWDNVNKGREIKKKMNKEVKKTASKPSKVKQSPPTDEKIYDSTKADSAENESVASESYDVQEEFSEELDEGLVRKSTMEDFEQTPEDVEMKQITYKKKSKKQPTQKIDSQAASEKAETKMATDIDPLKFISMPDTVIINSSVPVTEEGNEEDEDEQRRMTLAEAFADDDVIEQFKEEKKQVISASTHKDIDLTLPGWGEWGGSGLKLSRRKKRQFIIKAPPAPKRRDDNQGNLIINQDKNTNMRRQQVNDLPFPFRSAASFEYKIRAPVTSTFIPETAVRKLAAPKVLTKIGTIIAPMTDDVLISAAKRNKETQDKMELENRKKPTPGKYQKRKKSSLITKPTKKSKIQKNQWQITSIASNV
ncbi:LOW QUALITY PROTEIN: U3 small nucleolar RNA-associated protein 14 homolog A-like [Daphnia magna]|uniref:LOW QUALITY PROTEIN: U3 small nucleolar RNA-associated protein 14 homolog A-like n=1 Tax=Daphnia magna TaxID=35525 RepID=UPI001E1BBD09|nr:LOW QUALITY PROTEIN: U3 small nucleolar RNA-associated protein 14 homolog A-like [Daphnia magna]